MRIVSLCSSSKSNCTYIENNGEALLVDIGCSYRALCNGLSLAGRSPDMVKAVVITHEHSDHVSGLLQFSKNHNVPIFASEGTLSAIIRKGLVAPDAVIHTADELINAPLDMRVQAFRTPHDSAESVGYTIDNGGFKIAVCTDLGHISGEVRENLTGCRFVLLESNYDVDMIEHNPRYPRVLKDRIRSDRGHLSNTDSSSFVCELVRSGTVSLLLGHLSQENNTPDTARNCALSALASIGAKKGRDFLLDVAAVTGNGKAIAV